MRDVLPDLHNYNTFIKKVSRHVFRKNWFRRISTPIIEDRDLFLKWMWENSDIFIDEIYQFKDKKWRNLALRPESTTWILRSYINEELQSQPQPLYFYYINQQFKYVNPSSEDFREFNQVGAEIIGEKDPILDAELIYIWYRILNWVGLEWKYTIKISTLWNKKDREKYRGELENYYSNKKQNLCETCQNNLEKDIFKLFTCEEEDCKILKSQLPLITKFLKKDSKKHYEYFKEFLDIMNVPYEEDLFLTPWMPYYNNTFWQMVYKEDDKKDVIIWSWGRYDDLSKQIWSEDEIPAVWFALDSWKVIQKIIDNNIKIINKDRIHLYFIQLWDDAKKVVLPLAMEARKMWINTLTSLWTPSLWDQLKKAMRIWALYVVIIWVMEAKNWQCQIRDMEAWTSEEIKQADLIEYAIEKIWEKNLDFYNPGRDLTIWNWKLSN